eukprot:scaffold38001_cov68-Cyclotella_meneghiniana.AAC.4
MLVDWVQAVFYEIRQLMTEFYDLSSSRIPRNSSRFSYFPFLSSQRQWQWQWQRPHHLIKTSTPPPQPTLTIINETSTASIRSITKI